MQFKKTRGADAASARKATRAFRKVEARLVEHKSITILGSTVLNEQDFKRFEQCMKNPEAPTESMVRAARLYATLSPKLKR